MRVAPPPGAHRSRSSHGLAEVRLLGAFILGGQRIIELAGMGLASGVLLDALIIRSILVPALMLKLGDANWKLPARAATRDSRRPHPEARGTSSAIGDA